MEEKDGRKQAVIVLLILLCLALTGTVVYLLQTREKETPVPEQEKWDTGLDADAKGGADSGILIPGYDTVAMEAGSSSLSMSIGNPKDNHCVMRVTLFLADGTKLYQSDILSPGDGMEEISLSQKIEAGTYDVTARFECFTDKDTLKPLNVADSGFVLIAEKGE